MNDILWTDDPSVLLDKPFDFFPIMNDPFNVKMNAFMRLSIYLAIVLIFFYSNPKPLLLVIGTVIVTLYLSFKHKETDKPRETLENLSFQEIAETHTVPTTDNPLMNFTTSDLLNVDEDGTIQPKLPIVDPLFSFVSQEITDRSHDDIFRDVTDVFDKKLTDRQFYTMPVTNVIDDRETWQKWCYNTPASCKEDSICYQYEDLRANRPEFPITKVLDKI